MHAENDLVPNLPECVRAAVANAEQLFTTVMETPFPDLADEPADAQAAVAVVVAARRWADTLDTAHCAVVELFPPHETGVAIDLQTLGHTDFGSGGQYVHLPPYGAQGHGQTQYRELRMDVASDVLEPVPVRFRDCLVGAFPFSPGREFAPFDDQRIRDQVREEIQEAWDAEGWSAIRKRLAEGRMVVLSKSLGLVAWVRACAKELRSATLPEIVWARSRKYDGHVVRVSLAGASREIELTRSEYELLDGLTTGTANATRTTKAELVAKLPELAPYIESMGAASPKTTRYSIPTAVARRIRVTPNIPAVSSTHSRRSKSRPDSEVASQETD